MRDCLHKYKPVMLLILATLLAGAAPAAGADSPSADRVRKTAEKTVGIDAKTQHMMEDWAVEERDMLDRIEDLSAQLKQTQWQQDKNTIFIRTLEEKIAGLKQRAAEIEKVESELLPVLDATLDRLSTLVLSDIPAAPDRRRENISRTRAVLDDYDTGLLAKTRALFDSMSREVDLGYTVEVSEQEIETGEGLRQVKLLRVGRIGLFAVTLDGHSGFAWDRSGDRFVPLEGSVRDLTEAVEMAEGIRLIGLSRLPLNLPRVTAGGSGGSGLAEREQTDGGNRGELN